MIKFIKSFIKVTICFCIIIFTCVIFGVMAGVVKALINLIISDYAITFFTVLAFLVVITICAGIVSKQRHNKKVAKKSAIPPVGVQSLDVPDDIRKQLEL